MTCRVGNVILIFIKTRHFLIVKLLLDEIIRVIFLLSLQNNKIRDSYFMEGAREFWTAGELKFFSFLFNSYPSFVVISDLRKILCVTALLRFLRNLS